MKRCEYCGQEFPDEVTVCPVDGNSVVAFDPRPDLPPGAAMSIAAFGVLSTFSGVGAAWIVVSTIARVLNHFSASPPANPFAGRPGDGFIANSIPILLAGGVIGLVAGLVGRTYWVKRNFASKRRADGEAIPPEAKTNPPERPAD